MSAAASFASRGVLLLLFRGLLHTFQLSLVKTLRESGYPYFRLMAAVCLLACFPIMVLMFVLQTPLPSWGHLKWVVMRGLFGVGSFVCCVLAAQLGAPLGDLEALRSVNMVAAAILGRVFLNEPFSPLTAVALSCSVAGAMFISQPEWVFGEHATGGKGDVRLAHALAVASGLFTAGIFVASRKAPGTSVWVQALSSHVMSSLAAGLLPMSGVVQDFSFTPLAAAPFQAAGLFALLFGNTFISTMTLSAAAQWCTAAESAIVSTSAGMGFGFAAQIELFGLPPDRLSVCGASLMFCGVLIMASTQAKPAEELKVQQAAAEEEIEDGRPQQPLLNVEATKPASTDVPPPGASDVSTCDCDLRDVEDASSCVGEDVAV